MDETVILCWMSDAMGETTVREMTVRDTLLAVRSDASTEVSPLQGRGWAERPEIRVLFRSHSYVPPVSPNPASMAALDASSGYPDPTRSRTSQSPTSYLHMVTGRRVCS